MSKAPAGSKEKKKLADYITTQDEALVLFYATWCPHSQRFLPIFTEYSRNRPNRCFTVAIDEIPELCEEYAIEYYPTVILFRKGKISKRLDAKPGIGLDQEQLEDFTKDE
jgi:thiol-disulfide isomerase/thioredoxin